MAKPHWRIWVDWDGDCLGLIFLPSPRPSPKGRGSQVSPLHEGEGSGVRAGANLKQLEVKYG